MSWDDGTKPSPIEALHDEIMKGFQELRKSKFSGEIEIPVDGIAFSNIIAMAKTKVYEKYPNARENVPADGDMYSKGFKDGVHARDKQLARRFPTYCAFLSAVNLELPEKD